METKTAIDLAGSSSKLAALIGVTPGAISQWGELVPKTRVWQLKVLRPYWYEPQNKRKTRKPSIAGA